MGAALALLPPPQPPPQPVGDPAPTLPAAVGDGGTEQDAAPHRAAAAGAGGRHGVQPGGLGRAQGAGGRTAGAGGGGAGREDVQQQPLLARRHRPHHDLLPGPTPRRRSHQGEGLGGLCAGGEGTPSVTPSVARGSAGGQAPTATSTQGDSGSPLVCGQPAAVAGVMSFSGPCPGDPLKPPVATSAVGHKKWIQRTLRRGCAARPELPSPSTRV